MRLLVVKLADLGDMLLSEPALRSLRKAFPAAQIDVLTTPHAAEILRHLDASIRPITFDKAEFDALSPDVVFSGSKAGRMALKLRTAKYDCVVLLHHLTTTWGTVKYRALALSTGAKRIAGLDNGRGTFLTHRAIDRGFGWKHESDYMLEVARVAGGSAVHPEPRFHVIDEPDPIELPAKFVAIAPQAGSYSKARVWPLSQYRTLTTRLVETGWPVLVIGGVDAVEAGRELKEAGATWDLTGKTTLNQTARLLQRANVCIGNDSFPGHLSSAVGTPSVAIFGPSSIHAWRPRSAKSVAVSANLPCSPCLYTGYRLGRPEGCASRSCLRDLPAAAVLDATMELLSA